jgi:amidohydrolase
MNVGTPIFEELKKAAVNVVDAEYLRLRELALRIHATPELGLKEFKASSWLCEYLMENGFEVESGICELSTAFRASYGKTSPRIAVLAEYDALPGMGHACGHNLIGTIAVGAAVASKLTVDRCGGSVVVIGTPAEEALGGKILMTKRGVFSDLDAALLVHPDVDDTASTIALACQNLFVEFFGKSSHASASPEKGVNALEAMILAFNAIDALRQHIKNRARIHGVITDGGEAPNIVPAHSSASFMVRAADDAYLDELQERVINCFAGAATATGARLEYRWDELRYSAMRTNRTLAKFYASNMLQIGRPVSFPLPDDPAGSTDMGNVSQVVPAIHPMVAIAPHGVSLHSPEFALAAASEAGLKGMKDAAKAVAMTITDILASHEVLHKVSEEFYHSQ